MSRPIDLKHLGKLAEELGEAQAAVARRIIQGIDERKPVAGKPNREWLEDELADVLANLLLVGEHFGLDNLRMAARAERKTEHLRRWHAMLSDVQP
jgi:NTP pyrophosphatase (non-canonical NTP hydrolase)